MKVTLLTLFVCGFCVAIPSAHAATSPTFGAVKIAPGKYALGDNNGPADARPQHEVPTKGFWIDQYEVTNSQFLKLIHQLDVKTTEKNVAGPIPPSALSGKDKNRLWEGREGQQDRPFIALDDDEARYRISNGKIAVQTGFENHPVAESTWYGAVEYCNLVGGRLPTEAEWEIAAAGKSRRLYPWGNELPTPQKAAYGRRTGQTETVGNLTAGATPDKIYDMAGNVQEWTSSLYRPYPYNATDGREDLSVAGERVTRGGDHVFDSRADQLTTRYRKGYSRKFDRGHRHIGFRCVYDSDPAKFSTSPWS